MFSILILIVKINPQMPDIFKCKNLMSFYIPTNTKFSFQYKQYTNPKMSLWTRKNNCQQFVFIKSWRTTNNNSLVLNSLDYMGCVGINKNCNEGIVVVFPTRCVISICVIQIIQIIQIYNIFLRFTLHYSICVRGKNQPPGSKHDDEEELIWIKWNQSAIRNSFNE